MCWILHRIFECNWVSSVLFGDPKLKPHETLRRHEQNFHLRLVMSIQKTSVLVEHIFYVFHEYEVLWKPLSLPSFENSFRRKVACSGMLFSHKLFSAVWALSFDGWGDCPGKGHSATQRFLVWGPQTVQLSVIKHAHASGQAPPHPVFGFKNWNQNQKSVEHWFWFPVSIWLIQIPLATPGPRNPEEKYKTRCL